MVEQRGKGGWSFEQASARRRREAEREAARSSDRLAADLGPGKALDLALRRGHAGSFVK
jgi:hypothetical protein